MFVNISPTIPSINETICSLRFANQVRYAPSVLDVFVYLRVLFVSPH
jgi:hypothetical protein